MNIFSIIFRNAFEGYLKYFLRILQTNYQGFINILSIFIVCQIHNEF